MTTESLSNNDQEGTRLSVDLVGRGSRIALMVKRKLRGFRKKGRRTPQQARLHFSRLTGIPDIEVYRIESGFLPTSAQIDLMISGLKWDVFPLFGIEKRSYDEYERGFLDELHISKPSAEDRLAIKSLIKECLLQLYGDQNEEGQK